MTWKYNKYFAKLVFSIILLSYGASSVVHAVVSSTLFRTINLKENNVGI